MRVIVCGGRDHDDEYFVQKTLDRLHKEYGFTLVIEGCAPGADRFAERWARKNNIPLDHNPAEWHRYKRAAGPIRNRRMALKEPELVVAFPTTSLAHSKGTADMVSIANAMGIPVLVEERE